MEPIQLGRGDAEFIRKVEAESGEVVKKCYQCGNCSAGCPMSFTYDYSVTQVMRLLQLGRREEVLSCKAIWMCATCETCSTRCPNEINVSRIMDVCRHIARREGYPGVRSARVFADSFIESVRWFGRAHEMGLMGMYKLRSGKFFDDLSLAPTMMLKNKLPVSPHFIKRRGDMSGIFKRYKERRDRLKAEAKGGGNG